MANRYDNGSVAKFNPFTYQELAVTPMMQRQKHDQLLAQQEMLRQGLAKTNPHEKYFDEAVRLKNELNNQITSQADLLAKEGVTPNSQAEFLKLNSNYQETMSPTGKLGMINNHNVKLQATYKDYIDEAIKAGQSPAIAKLHADMAIKKHMQQPLYDERGRVVDFSAGNAAPKYIDNVKWINELAAKVGFTQDNWAQASSGISKTADGRFVVNESAKGMTKDNIENLNRLAQAANREVADPASEIRQNIDYNFKNPQTELDNMLNQLYARRERESGVTDRNKTYGSVDWSDEGKNKPANPNMTAYNLGDGQLNATNQNLMRELGMLSTKNNNLLYDAAESHSPFAKQVPQSQKTELVKKSEPYRKLASSINRTLPSNQRFKEGSKEEDIAVANYLKKYGNTVIQNRLVDPFSDETGLLFADKTIGKEANAAQVNLWKRVKIGASKMVDKEGKEIPLDKVTNFTYNGDLTPESNVKVFKGDSRQNYLAHTGTVKIGDEIKQVYISRNSDDFKTPQYKGGVDKNKINNVIATQPNIYHNFKPNSIEAFKNYGMKDVEVKYNENSKTYDVSYKENDGSNIDIKFDNDQNGSAETKFNKWLIKLNE